MVSALVVGWQWIFHDDEKEEQEECQNGFIPFDGRFSRPGVDLFVAVLKNNKGMHSILYDIITL